MKDYVSNDVETAAYLARMGEVPPDDERPTLQELADTGDPLPATPKEELDGSN